MKTITYNPETHVLVPVEPSGEMCDAATADSCWENMNPQPSTAYRLMLAAAPQPEPVDVGSVGWKHDCAALCANDIELWIDRCPHCGKPRHNHPPTDDELLNKAEQVESEPFGYYENGRFSVITDGGPDKYRERKGYQGAIYTTPQPDRTAELEAELAASQAREKQLRNALETFIAEHEECEDSDGWVAQMCSMEALHVADEALSTPFTPQALNELIEKVEKLTLERCAVITGWSIIDMPTAVEISTVRKYSKAIRALPVGHIKLEDLL